MTRCPKTFKGKSRVEQQHRDECNINTIMRKMHAQGILPHFKQGGNFGDFTSYTHFHDMQNRIADAHEDFMRLPSELRYKFDNDPGKLVQFLENPENLSECRRLGLIAPEGHNTPEGKNSAQESSEAASASNEATQPPKATKAQKGPEKASEVSA